MCWNCQFKALFYFQNFYNAIHKISKSILCVQTNWHLFYLWEWLTISSRQGQEYTQQDDNYQQHWSSSNHFPLGSFEPMVYIMLKHFNSLEKNCAFSCFTNFSTDFSQNSGFGRKYTYTQRNARKEFPWRNQPRAW